MSTPDRFVLLTGTSTGIGHMAARDLDRRGWRVLAGVRTVADQARLRDVLSARSEPILLDVTDSANIERVREYVTQLTGGRLDALVNNAGIVMMGPCEALTSDALRKQLDVNLIGLFELTTAMLPMVRAAKGRIVNVGSISGRVTWPFNGLYAASKHAVRALTDSFRTELAAQGVRVSLVEPGAMKTAIWQKRVPQELRRLDEVEPQVAAQYRKLFHVVERSMDRIDERAPVPSGVVRAIRHALESKQPRRNYVVGMDAHAQLLFKALPGGLRDRLLSFGIRRFAQP